MTWPIRGGSLSAPGFWELVALAVLALMIFGPDKLPELARGAGKMIVHLRREASSTLSELREAAELDDLRSVADELRSSGDELRRAVALTGPVASPARPRAGAAGAPAATVRAGVGPGAGEVSGARADGPPPFDPDAT
jgi:sec-independent protein translocase protein TatB